MTSPNQGIELPNLSPKKDFMPANHGFTNEMTLKKALNQNPACLREHIFHSKILVLRSEACDLDAYISLINHLGTVVHHVLEQFCLPQHREILLISNLYRDGKPIGVHDGGSYWHTDMSYKRRNTLFTSLHSYKVPLTGGETEFIDCEAGLTLLCEAINAGYIDLSVKLPELSNLMVIHRFGNREKLRDQNAPIQTLNNTQKEVLFDEVRHPLILSHPITGKKSLYAVAATSMLIEGFTEQQSQLLLDTIFDFLIEHAPRYIHHYEKGDIIIWDNLTTLHRGSAIESSCDENNCRILYRINVNYLYT